MSSVPSIDDMINALVIGDPHFREKHLQQGEQLIDKCIEIATSYEPTFIVILGDCLHTHESADVEAYNQLFRFLSELSVIAHCFVLIGNHDYKNASQFLSDKHFLNPFKRWENITIIDRPTKVEYGSYTFVMCPFVPTGRLVEALDSHKNVTDIWRTCTCIFGHQEMQNSIFTDAGDEWSEEFPPIICGHIHHEMQYDNIYYPGSSMQVSSDEDPEKKVWIVSFDSTEEGFSIEKISLGISGKKIVTCDIAKATKITNKLCSTAKLHSVKLTITGTEQELEEFRNSKQYEKLEKANVKIFCSPVKEKTAIKKMIASYKKKTFHGILEQLIETKAENVKAAYLALKEVSKS